MSFFKFLHKRVNEQIEEAMDRGDFDNLPGKGKPLDLEDDAHIPADLRMAYKVMKNSGVTPGEISLMKGAAGLRDRLLRDSELTEAERSEIRRKIAILDLEYNIRVEQLRKTYSGY